MKKLFIITFLIVSLASASYSQSSNKNRTATEEDRILDTILDLKEVRDREKYVVDQTKGKHHLKSMIPQEPSKSDPYYLVKVVEDNGMSYYTHFNFYVYPNTLRIEYYDTMTGEAMDLQTWRKKEGIIDTIAVIRNEYTRINNLSSKMRIVKKDIADESTEGGELKKFYLGDSLKKTILVFYGEMGIVINEYYFSDAKLIFSYKVEKWYNKPMSMDGSKIERVEENRFYFFDQKLIRWVKNNGKIEDRSLYSVKEKDVLLELKDIYD